MKKYTKLIAIAMMVVSATVVLLPSVAGAIDSNPGTLLNNVADKSGQTTTRDLPTIIGNIIQWVLGLVGVVLLIMFIYGGVLYATSAGNEEKVETGKKVMLYAIIGVVIIALAFALTRYVVDALFTQ